MYYPEILVRMPVMNKVQFLFASEPCKPFKTGPLYMIFLIEKNVRVERYSTGNDLNHEQISGQDEICTPPTRNTGIKKNGVLLPSSSRYTFETR